MATHHRLTAVGIDLGTTRSVLAWLDSAGRPSTWINPEGELTTPSVVFFDRGGVIVGKEAAKAAAFEPGRAAEGAKRDLGQPVCARPIAGHSFPPEVIQAILLDHLRQAASARLGPVRQVVITVPAYFNEPRRKATQDAGRLAGLDVLDVINEPTAAALAFGSGRAGAGARLGEPCYAATPAFGSQRAWGTDPAAAGRESLLVYDLGGGTFDVTLLEVDGPNYRVVATAGDVYLGGLDWDLRIADLAADEFQRQFGVDPRQDLHALAALRLEANEAKHALTAREEVHVHFQHQGNRLRLPLSRARFESLTADLLDRTLLTVDKVLREARYAWSQVTRLLLVGGSTRMPMVRRRLIAESGREVDQSLSPDEAVAHGAAIYAGWLRRGDGAPPSGIKVTDVNSHDLGVLAVEPGTGLRRRQLLIPRNTPLPAVGLGRFVTQRDGQTSVRVRIIEGGDATGAHATPIGQCVVTGLPPDLPAGTRVNVTCNYSPGGRLTVGAALPGTGRHAQVRIERAGGLSDAQYEYWRERIETGRWLEEPGPPPPQPESPDASLADEATTA